MFPAHGAVLRVLVVARDRLPRAHKQVFLWNILLSTVVVVQLCGLWGDDKGLFGAFEGTGRRDDKAVMGYGRGVVVVGGTVRCCLVFEMGRDFLD